MQRDLFSKQRRAARRFIERTRESRSSERLCKHAGRRAFSDGGSRDEGGRATASRDAGVSRGIDSSSASRSGEAPMPSRDGGRHVPDSTVPHGVERGAGWLRCGDLAMPGVREARASARKSGTPACWRVEAFGGDHRTTNGHGFRQLKTSGQPGRRRSGDASRDGIGCRGTAGMREARQRGSFGSEGVE